MGGGDGPALGRFCSWAIILGIFFPITMARSQLNYDGWCPSDSSHGVLVPTEGLNTLRLIRLLFLTEGSSPRATEWKGS